MSDRPPLSLYDDNPRQPPGWLLLIVLVLLLIGLGATMGMLFGPDIWYQRLQKPSWNPPSWVFGPVWTLLYALMAISLWVVRRDRRSDPELRENRVAQPNASVLEHHRAVVAAVRDGAPLLESTHARGRADVAVSSLGVVRAGAERDTVVDEPLRG
jgi:hypothetical protein